MSEANERAKRTIERVAATKYVTAYTGSARSIAVGAQRSVMSIGAYVVSLLVLACYACWCLGCGSTELRVSTSVAGYELAYGLSPAAWPFVCITVLLGWLCALYLRTTGSVRGSPAERCVWLLLLSSLAFLAAADLVSLVFWFELVNVPLVGLLSVRPVVTHVGGVKGWVSALWLLLSYGLLSGVALLLGLYLLAAEGGAWLWTGAGTSAAVSLVLVAAFVKLSVVPLHVWLGKVHAEASTVGSVLLAGVALKLGWVLVAGVAIPQLVLPMSAQLTTELLSHSGSPSVGVLGSVYCAGLIAAAWVLSCGLVAAVDAKRWVAL